MVLYYNIILNNMLIQVNVINQTPLLPQPLRQIPPFLNNKLFLKTEK